MEESGTFEMSRQSGLRRKPRGYKAEQNRASSFFVANRTQSGTNQCTSMPYIWWFQAPNRNKKGTFRSGTFEMSR